MNLTNAKVVIDASWDNAKISQLAEDIVANLSDIQEVEVDDSGGVESSAVFSLLASVRKTAPHIKISFIDKDFVEVKGIGTISIDVRG